MPVANLEDLEMYEGMLVSVSAVDGNSIVISEYYNFDRYGDMVVCSSDDEAGRVFQYTENFPPDVAGYAAHMAVFGMYNLTRLKVEFCLEFTMVH